MEKKSFSEVVQMLRKNKITKIVIVIVIALIILNGLGIFGGKSSKAEKFAKNEITQEYKDMDYKKPKVSVKCVAKNTANNLYAIDVTITGKDWGGSRFKDQEIVVIQMTRQSNDIVLSYTYSNKDSRSKILADLKEQYNIK